MERRPAVGSKCGVGILHVFQVKDHHQERSDNNIDCSPSHLAHYIKKTVTVRFILDHPVHASMWVRIRGCLRVCDVHVCCVLYLPPSEALVTALQQVLSSGGSWG